MLKELSNTTLGMTGIRGLYGTFAMFTNESDLLESFEIEMDQWRQEQIDPTIISKKLRIPKNTGLFSWSGFCITHYHKGNDEPVDDNFEGIYKQLFTLQDIEKWFSNLNGSEDTIFVIVGDFGSYSIISSTKPLSNHEFPYDYVPMDSGVYRWSGSVSEDGTSFNGSFAKIISEDNLKQYLSSLDNQQDESELDELFSVLSDSLELDNDEYLEQLKQFEKDQKIRAKNRAKNEKRLAKEKKKAERESERLTTFELPDSSRETKSSEPKEYRRYYYASSYPGDEVGRVYLDDTLGM